METKRRPAFHRASRFVAIGRITIMPDHYIEAGEELPPMRRASLLRLFKARMIGPVGDEWTNMLFRRRLRRLEQDKEAKRLYKDGEQEMARIQKAMAGEVKLGTLGAVLAKGPQARAAPKAPVRATAPQGATEGVTGAQGGNPAHGASGAPTEPHAGSFEGMRDPPSFEPPPRGMRKPRA